MNEVFFMLGVIAVGVLIAYLVKKLIDSIE
jgi:hypothetical protein